jgi:hypothetical protein
MSVDMGDKVDVGVWVRAAFIHAKMYHAEEFKLSGIVRPSGYPGELEDRRNRY